MSWDKEPPTEEEIATANLNVPDWAREAPTADEISNWESLGRGGAQSASLGFGDEAQGALEAIGQAVGIKGLGAARNLDEWGIQSPNGLDAEKFKQVYAKTRDAERGADDRAKKANPNAFLAGEVGGGIATAALPMLKAGGSIGKMAATGAGLGTLGGLGASEAESVGGMVGDAAKGGAIGGIVGGGSGYALDRTGKAADKVFNGFKTKYGPKVMEYLESITQKKENAKEIQEAAKRFGVDATPGMLAKNERLGKLESKLEQSPTLFGWLVSRKTEKVRDALDRVPSEVLADASTSSPFAVGETVKGSMKKTVAGRTEKPIATMNEIKKSLPDIGVNEKSLLRVGNNIRKSDGAIFSGSPEARIAEEFAGWLQDARSVADITRLRERAGNALRSSQDLNEKQVLHAIYKKLTQLENNSVVRGATETMRNMAKRPNGKEGAKLAAEGETIGKNMVGDWKGAKKDYAKTMDDLRGFSETAGLGEPKTLSMFGEAVDGLRSENVVDKFMNPKDLRTMTALKSQFPEAFAEARAGRLGEISRKSQDNLGNYTSNKFFGQMKNVPDEASEMLFSTDQLTKVKDGRLLSNEVPSMVGPSGTPQGIDYGRVFDPRIWVRDAISFAAYKGVSEKTAEQIASSMLKSPKFQQLAVQNPKAFKAMVVDFSRRMPSERAIPRAAQQEQGPSELDGDSSTSANERVSDEEAKQKYIDGN